MFTMDDDPFDQILNDNFDLSTSTKMKLSIMYARTKVSVWPDLDTIAERYTRLRESGKLSDENFYQIVMGPNSQSWKEDLTGIMSRYRVGIRQPVYEFACFLLNAIAETIEQRSLDDDTISAILNEIKKDFEIALIQNDATKDYDTSWAIFDTLRDTVERRLGL